MSIFSKIETAAKNVEAEYKTAVGSAAGDVRLGVSDVKAIAERVEDVVETLEARALSEIEWFLGTVEETLTKLQDYQTKLKVDIEAKSDALAKVQDTIAKVQAVQPTPVSATSSVTSALSATVDTLQAS